MIVITLTKVPRSLRGDLTKWCQEFQTGVYVGNVNAKVRDALWKRVQENIGRGEATMVYNTNNELGYQFRTTRSNKKVIDYDGIPLLMTLTEAPIKRNLGFSKAYKRHQASIYRRRQRNHQQEHQQVKEFVVVDVETTGLDFVKDEIISIGAVKNIDGQQEEFYRLIRIKQVVPDKISQLTGISNELLVEHGESLKSVLVALKDFIGSLAVISYNASFDQHFVQQACDEVKSSRFDNDFVDLMAMIKRHDLFLDNYQLSTVLKNYNIENKRPHNALADAQAEYQLALKLIKIGTLVF